MRRIATTAVAMAALTAVLPPAADGAARWSLRGAGLGNGVGMSQWGAYGYAKRGADHGAILRHYYRGTGIGLHSAQAVRVLLARSRSVVTFSSAASAGGRGLDPQSVYKATRSGSTVVLLSPDGRVLERVYGVLTVQGVPRVRLLGRAANGVRNGIYRGSIELSAAGGRGLNVINELDLESYVRGVVSNLVPSSWPAAALEAQAVAARTYAITTDFGGPSFDQYADRRSQVYRGYLSETPTTGAAVSSTTGEVVTVGGQPVPILFFSTSGGHTENVENVFVGASPQPWLRGVRDPYDTASPHRRWGPYSYSRRSLKAKLGSWVRGRFKGIKVLERGVSPRIVRAEVRGLRGKVRVSGHRLRTRLDLPDSWFYLRRVSSSTRVAPRDRTTSGARRLVTISGTVSPGRTRFVMLQRRVKRRWVKVRHVPLEKRGAVRRYSVKVARAGVYRVLAGWAAGPRLRVRP